MTCENPSFNCSSYLPPPLSITKGTATHFLYTMNLHYLWFLKFVVEVFKPDNTLLCSISFGSSLIFPIFDNTVQKFCTIGTFSPRDINEPRHWFFKFIKVLQPDNAMLVPHKIFHLSSIRQICVLLVSKFYLYHL